MFIEATPNSELISAIKVVEEKYKIAENQRIKFIEKNGRKLIETIRVSDPFRENCKEEDCLPCRNTNRYANCRKTNIGYTIQCKNCQSKGKTQVYEGESCRNMYQRSREHIKLMEKKKEGSVLNKHIEEKHTNDEIVEFEMKLAGTFQTPLQRIINEGVRISNRNDKELMNTKTEFFKPSVKKKSVI